MERDKIEKYLEVLACPLCKGDLVYLEKEEDQGFYCEKCALLYPIVEDIPVMLPEEAISLKDEPS